MDTIYFDCAKSNYTDCTNNSQHDVKTQKKYKSSHYPYGVVLLCKYQLDNADILGWSDDGNTLTLVETEVGEPTISISDIKCQNCGKNNDCGSCKCWWCEVVFK